MVSILDSSNGYGSLSRCTYLIAQLAWQPQEWQDRGRMSAVFLTCSDINHRCDTRSRRSGSHLTSSVQIAVSYLVSTEVFPASRSPLRHRHVIGKAERAGGRPLLGSRSLIWAGAMDRRAPERAGVRNPLSAERGGTGTGSPYAYFSYDRQVVRNFTRPQPACPWI